jgi:iron complex outermembrane recepter protein
MTASILLKSDNNDLRLIWFRTGGIMTNTRSRFDSFTRLSFLRTPIAMAVAVALLKHSLPLYAADAAADQPATADQRLPLEEITVTATRRHEDIQNVPFNLEAVTSDTIEELHATKIDDIAAYLPGVSVYTQGNYQASAIVVRGLNTSALDPGYGSSNGVPGAVATYLGEVPLFYDFRLLDLDRVEALLGPQGTLYGTGTLGGVVRYIPKEPNLSNFEADVHVRGTDQEHAPTGGYDGDGVINVPLIDGVLGFRAVLGYYHDAGFITDNRLVRDPGVSLPQPNFNDPSAVAANLYSQKGVNFDHTLTARAELLYKPAASFEAELTVMHQRSTSDGADVTRDQPGQGTLFAQVLGTGPYDNAVRILETADRKVDLGSLVLTQHLGFADLTSASTYSERKVTQTSDGTDGFLSSSSYTNFPSFIAYYTGPDFQDTYTEEVRLVSSHESRFNYIVGAFYEDQKTENRSYTYTPGYPAFIGVNRPDQLYNYSDGTESFSDKAVFGEVGYQFTPAWQATVGGRWFKDAFDGTEESSYPLNCQPCSPPNGLNVQTENFTGPSIDTAIYKFNTSYRFSPDFMVYATVSDGYRAGELNEHPVCSASITTQCILPSQVIEKPDRTRNYEVGIRSTWFDKRLLLNADYYYINWTDLRVPEENIQGIEFITNGSAARSQGLEMQFQAQLSSHLNLLGSYTHAQAYMTAVSPGLISGADGTFPAEPGDRLPDSPRDFGALHLRYSRKLPGDYSFDATYGIKAQGDMFETIGDKAGGLQLGGYAVQDASLGLKKDNLEVSCFVENLTNRYAYTGSSTEGYNGLVENGYVYRGVYFSVLPPRLFGLDVTVHFGPR